MAIRRLLRGTVQDSELESLAREAARRRGEEFESVRELEADNWLSTPAVVNEQFFIKVISTTNTLVHGILTTGRNIGVFSSGSEGFFERHSTPIEMAEHELAATGEMRELGLNVPEPLAVFEHDGFGVVILEYLPAFETLAEVGSERAESLAPALFESLQLMHGAGFAHGDLRSENVLVKDEELYFIDATNVDPDAVEEARAYDIACALAVLEPIVGARTTVAIAASHYDDETLLAAESYLDFVNMRPDHSFESLSIQGEIEKVLS